MKVNGYWGGGFSNNGAFGGGYWGVNNLSPSTSTALAFSDFCSIVYEEDLLDSFITDDSTTSPAGTAYNLETVDSVSFLDSGSIVLDQSIFDVVGFTDSSGQIFEANIVDTFITVDISIRGPTEFINDSVTLADNVVEQKISQPFDFETVTFIDHVIWSISHSETIHDSIHISTFVFANNSLLCDSYPVAFTQRDIFSLYYPVTSPTFTLDLRSPQFGNWRHYTKSAKIKRTVDGFPRVTIKATWPSIEIFHYLFRGLTSSNRDDFISLFDQSGGNYIKVLDQDNIAWTGLITEPQISTDQEGPGCQYKLEFTFRGTKL